jgi:hypothetical protein
MALMLETVWWYACRGMLKQFMLLHSVTRVQLRLMTVLGNCGCVAVASFLDIPSPLEFIYAKFFYQSCNFLFVYLPGLLGCVLSCCVVCHMSCFRMLADWDSWQCPFVLFAVRQLQPWGICGVFAMPTNTLLLNILPAQGLGKSSGGVCAQCNRAWFDHAYSGELRTGSHITAWVVVR